MRSTDPSRPPPKLRHNILAWRMACDLVGGLHALPLGLRLPRRRLPGASRQSLENTPTPPALPLSDFPPDLVDAWEVVKVLLAKKHAAACREFNRRFASSVIRLPRLESIGNRGETGERGAVMWVHPDYADGNLRHFTFFPPAVSLWFMLSEWQIHSRVKQCPECNSLFLDYTRGLSSKNCSDKCTSRASSRKNRMDGKARRG